MTCIIFFAFFRYKRILPIKESFAIPIFNDRCDPLYYSKSKFLQHGLSGFCSLL